MIQRMFSVFLSAILGLFTWSTLSAQSEWLAEDAISIQREFIDELGSECTDYWNPRLNEYKRIIDRTLSPNDLEKLNSWRVRWGILMNDLSAKMNKNAEVDIDDSDKEIEFSLGAGDEEEFTEIMEIWMGTMSLAEGYRSSLDYLSENVVEDASGFITNVADFIEEFVQAHHAELAEDEEGQELLSNSNEFAEELREEGTKIKKDNKGFMEVYSLAVEPFIMLYNGGNLGDMLGDMLPFLSNQTSSANLDVVAGLLPEGAVLQQNYPNPASSKTSIPFTLAETSSATTLRLYSSDGSLVKSIDLGRFEPGKHSYEVDVTDLSNDSYLYHLTILTDAGEMVYSKVMKVVR